MVFAAPPPSSWFPAGAAAPAVAASSSCSSAVGTSPAAAVAPASKPRWVPVEKDFRTSNGALWAFVTTSYQTVTLKTQGTVRMPVYSSLGAGQYGRVFEVRRADGGTHACSSQSRSDSCSHTCSSHSCSHSCSRSSSQQTCSHSSSQQTCSHSSSGTTRRYSNKNGGNSSNGNAESGGASNGDRNSRAERTSSSSSGSRSSNTRNHQRKSRDQTCSSASTKEDFQDQQEGPVNAAGPKLCSCTSSSNSNEETAGARGAVSPSVTCRPRNGGACAAQAEWGGKMAASAGQRHGAPADTAAAAEKGDNAKRTTTDDKAVETAARGSTAVAEAPVKSSKLECSAAAAAREKRGGARATAVEEAARGMCAGEGGAAEGTAEAGQRARRSSGRPAGAAAAASVSISNHILSACSKTVASATGRATAAVAGAVAGREKAGSSEEARAAATGREGPARTGNPSSLSDGNKERAATWTAAETQEEERKKDQKEEQPETAAVGGDMGRRGGGAAATAKATQDAAAALAFSKGKRPRQEEEADVRLHNEEAKQQPPQQKETEIQQNGCCRGQGAGKRGRENACSGHGDERTEDAAADGDRILGEEAAASAAAVAVKKQRLTSLLPIRGEEPAAIGGKDLSEQASGGKKNAGDKVRQPRQNGFTAGAEGGSSCCEVRTAAVSNSSSNPAFTGAVVSTKRVSSRGAAVSSRSHHPNCSRSAASSSGSSEGGSCSASAADEGAHCGGCSRSCCFLAEASCSSAGGCGGPVVGGSDRSSSSRTCGPCFASAAAAAPSEGEQETRYAAKLFLLADYETDGITADVLRELSFYNAFSSPSSSSSGPGASSCSCSSSSAALSSSCSSVCPAATTCFSSSPSSAFPAPPPPSASCRCCCCRPPPFPNFPACFGCLACLEVSAEFSEGYLNGVRYCSVIVVEKCKTDLATFVKGLWAQERMNISALKFYVWQLLNGVAKLHNQNIAHRDLKPENLLVAAANTSNGEQLYDGGVAVVKIADLGMGRKIRWELSQQAAGSSSQVFAAKQQPAGFLDRGGPAAGLGMGGGAAAAASASASGAAPASASCSASAAATASAKGSSSSPAVAQALRPSLSEQKLIEAADRMRQSGHVITLPYRPPELLVTDPSRQNSARCPIAEYGLSCDLWSLGVIILEMCLPQHVPRPPYRWQYAFVLHDARKASYQMEVMILENIFKVTGRPSSEELALLTREAGAQQAEGLHAFLSAFPQLDTNSRKLSINDFILNRGGLQLDELGLDLLARLLHISPTKRLSAQCALAHPWFHDLPYQDMNKLGLVSHLAELASPQLRRALPTAVRHCVMWWESTGRSVLHTQFAMHGLLHHMLLEEQRMRLRAAQQEQAASSHVHHCVLRRQPQRTSRQRRQQRATGQQDDAERQHHQQQQSQQQLVEEEHTHQQFRQQQKQPLQQEGVPVLDREEEQEEQQHRIKAGVLESEDKHQQLPLSSCTTRQPRQADTVFGGQQQQYSDTSGTISQQLREARNPVPPPPPQQQQQRHLGVSNRMPDVLQDRHDLSDHILQQQQQQQQYGALDAGDAKPPQQQRCITATSAVLEQQLRQHLHTREQQQQQSISEGVPASASVLPQHPGRACLPLPQKMLFQSEEDTHSVDAQLCCSAGAACPANSPKFQKQNDRCSATRAEQNSDRHLQDRGAAGDDAGSEEVVAEGSGEEDSAARSGPPATQTGAAVLPTTNRKDEGVASAAARKKQPSSSAAARAPADLGQSCCFDSAEDVGESVSSPQKRHKTDASAFSSDAGALPAAAVSATGSSSAAPPPQTVEQRPSSQGRGCREGRRGRFLSPTSNRAASAVPLPMGDAVRASHALHMLQQQQHRIIHPTGAESDDELVRSGPCNGHSPLCKTQAARCGSTSSLELPVLSSPKPQAKNFFLSGVQKSSWPSSHYGRTGATHNTDCCYAMSRCRCPLSCKGDCDRATRCYPTDATEQFSPAIDSKSSKYSHCTKQAFASCCNAKAMSACPTTTSSGQADCDSATSCHSTFSPGDGVCSSVQPPSEERTASTGEHGGQRTGNVERGPSVAPCPSADRPLSSKVDYSNCVPSSCTSMRRGSAGTVGQSQCNMPAQFTNGGCESSQINPQYITSVKANALRLPSAPVSKSGCGTTRLVPRAPAETIS